MHRRDFCSAVGTTAAILATELKVAAESPTKPRIKVGQIGVSHGHANKLAVYRKSAASNRYNRAIKRLKEILEALPGFDASAAVG